MKVRARHSIRATAAILAVLQLVAEIVAAATAGEVPTAAEARQFAQAGEYGEAARRFLVIAETAATPEAAVKARLNAASCLKLDGHLCAARNTLNEAATTVAQLPHPELRRIFLAELGSVLSLSADPSNAGPVLTRAAAAAEAAGDHALLAEIHNDLAVAHAAVGKPRAAFRAASEAFQHATTLGLEDLVVRARQNQLVAAFMVWEEDREALTRVRDIEGWDVPIADRLVESQRRFEACLEATRASAPQCFEAMAAGKAAVRYGMEKEGFTLLKAALEEARTTGIPDLERSALLILAELYLDHDRLAETAILLDQIRILPEPGNPLQNALLATLAAIHAHKADLPPADLRPKLEHAIREVDAIRSDLSGARQTSDLGRAFRDLAGQPYLLLAELEMEADRTREAVAAIEAFKARELQDFYRNDCISAALEKQLDLAAIEDGETAVLYAIALPDRLELITLTAKGVVHRTSPVGRDELYRLARRFRHHLEFDHGTYAFMVEAEALHDHLIAPLRRSLRESGIRHLVFVPDGPLAAIPLAALRERTTTRYLVQDFSLSVAPAMSLMPAAAETPTASGIMMAGLSGAYGNFSALPAAGRELAEIARLYEPSSVRLDDDFTENAFINELQTGRVGLVHIASHAEFNANAGGTFLLASDGRISIGELESAIRPRKFTGVPIDLLCLSACRTAVGDDQAALGLAGAAVKSGARSVLASLWYVDDAAASSMMISFHQRFSKGTGKSEALRAAQLDALAADPLAHPYLWAPFIMIGDWR